MTEAAIRAINIAWDRLMHAEHIIMKRAMEDTSATARAINTALSLARSEIMKVGTFKEILRCPKIPIGGLLIEYRRLTNLKAALEQ